MRTCLPLSVHMALEQLPPPFYSCAKVVKMNLRLRTGDPIYTDLRKPGQPCKEGPGSITAKKSRSLIPAPRKQRQVDCWEFKTSLSHKVSSKQTCLKEKIRSGDAARGCSLSLHSLGPTRGAYANNKYLDYHRDNP